MRIHEIYRNRSRPVISFEVFPPKTDGSYANLHRALPRLAALEPDFMTVTYGALGSTQDRTVEIASLILRELKVPVACHLTCVGASRAELEDLLRGIVGEGIRNIVALRGDPPSGEVEFVAPKDGFAHADGLVRHIRAFEQRELQEHLGVAVAGYPEKHIEAPDFATDLANLKRKVDSGADCVITQLFYDNRAFFHFVEAARGIGIAVPIVPGLLPIVSAKQIFRITSLCGACLPEELKLELEAAGENERKVEEIGVERCVRQARELIEWGVPGIHFYVLNRASHMERIMNGLGR